MPDLFDVLKRIVVGIVAQQQPKLYQPDTITKRNADGSVTLASGRTGFPEVEGHTFAPKDHVYVSQTADGRIVVNGPRSS